MRRYLFLQYKRILRALPGMLCVTVILLAGLFLALQLFSGSQSAKAENQKVRVALCGNLEDSFLQMGLAALKALDETRFSVDLLQMSPQEAREALAQGEIAAYILVPEGFMEEAMHGNILSLEYISAPDSAGIVALFASELTRVVSSLVLEAQKGVFGAIDAIYANGLPYRQGDINALALDYVQFILHRNNTYSLELLGVGHGLGLIQYLVCGFCVLLLALSCLPFAPLMICPDPALSRMLTVRGWPLPVQNFLDWLAYLAGLATVFLPLAGVLTGLYADVPDVWTLLPRLFSVLILVSAFSFFLYRLTADLISGILIQFFSAIAVSFLSGCLYPVYFFPASIQKLSGLLPAGLARKQLAGCFTGDGSATAGMMLYTIGFLAAATLAHHVRLSRQQR